MEYFRVKHPPKARPPICSYGHELSKTTDPPTHKHLLHILGELVNYLVYFLESILEGGRFKLGEPQCTSYLFKYLTAHYVIESMGRAMASAWGGVRPEQFKSMLPTEHSVRRNHKPMDRRVIGEVSSLQVTCSSYLRGNMSGNIRTEVITSSDTP